jgi:hypothetical protein
VLLAAFCNPCRRVIPEKPPVAQLLKISQNFIEPEDSLPYSQAPVTGPYPEPDKSSPHHPNIFL